MLTSTAPAPYDSASLLVRSTSAYDADGCIISVSRTNAGASQSTQTSYTRTGQPHSVTDPNGLQATFTDARGNTTKTSYDGFDRPTQTTYAFGSGLASSE